MQRRVLHDVRAKVLRLGLGKPMALDVAAGPTAAIRLIGGARRAFPRRRLIPKQARGQPVNDRHLGVRIVRSTRC
jgi:hypothetical protein